MNRIFSFKNLTKKIVIFFLVFFVLIFTNTKTTYASIYINPGNIKSLLDNNDDCQNTRDCELYINESKAMYTLYKVSIFAKDRDLTQTEVEKANLAINSYLTDLQKQLSKEYTSISTDEKNTIDSAVDLSKQNDEDKKAIAYLDSVLDNGQNIVNINILPVYEKMSSSDINFFQNARIKKIDLVTTDQITDVVRIWRRVYLYKEFSKFLTTGSTTIDLTKVNQKIIEEIKTQQTNATNGGKWNFSNAEQKLEVGEINPTNAYGAAIVTGVTFSFGTINQNNSPISNMPTNTNSMAINTPIGSPCLKGIGLWGVVTSSNPNCSIAAYLINITIQGINSLVNIVVGLAGSLFDWIYNTGVIKFNDWVVNSGAYIIYKTIILSLIVSVMTFLVFYLIIRRLIDDDGEKMNKILPRLILLSLFVYFSFTITGWVIDQSNIITIYLYRSMTHQDAKNPQGIADVLERTLRLKNDTSENNIPDSQTISSNIDNNYGISLGSWGAIPYTLGQLTVSIVAIFVLFQGAILILSRTIILLLCMIFSPIMLIPEGLTEFTDKYRKLVIENFTDNILLGPVFMFLVLLAVQIGQAAIKMTGEGPVLPKGAPTGFLGGIISSVLVIVVLQLAISASKSLSGSAGAQISGFVGKYAGKVGGLAFNTGKFVGNRALGGVMNNTQAGDKINDWITKGATKSGIRGILFKGVQNYTTKFGLDGDTKRNTEADEIANVHQKANSRQQFQIREDLEKRAKNKDKTAILALEQIDKKIEEKKNTEFKRDKDTREREDYQNNQNNKKNPPTSSGAAPVTENTRPINPSTQNSSSKEILKENKEESQKQSFLVTSGNKQQIQTFENGNKTTTNLPDINNDYNKQKVSSLKDRLVEKNGGKDNYKNKIIDNQKKQESLYQEKSLKEAQEKQDNEISAEKEKNRGYVPSAKDLDAQNSLKDRLKEKFSTRERMENGKIIKENSPELLQKRRLDLKTTQRNIERQKEEEYQNKALEKTQMQANVDEAKKIGSTANQEVEK